MNAPAPEADKQYSNLSGRPGGRLDRLRGGSWPIAVLALVGAGLLLAAEFRPLYIVHFSSYGSLPRSVSTGSHDSYALVPIVLLAAGLALVTARQRTLTACAALAGLGVLVLLITVIGDLPDTRAKGITHGLAFASTTAGAGLYLETLGAVALLGAGGAGLLSAIWAGRTPRRRRGSRARARVRVRPGSGSRETGIQQGESAS